MLSLMREIGTAVLLAVPGVGIAFLAKPMNLGEGFLWFGILFAFLVPICWLTIARSSGGVEGKAEERGPPPNEVS